MDVEIFKIAAAAHGGALEDFLKKLDETVPRAMSRIVAEEDVKVWEKVDCTTCANCCKTMTPVFTKADIKRAATHLRMSPKAFFDKWLMVEDDTGNTVNVKQPCQFLIENKCSIYAVRPKDCAEFPHHYKRPFDLYNETFIQNVKRCPATFILVENLKERIEREYEW